MHSFVDLSNKTKELPVSYLIINRIRKILTVLNITNTAPNRLFNHKFISN